MDIPRKIKKICMHCGGYTFKRRPVGLWAYCTVWEKWLDDAPVKTPPGKRSCEGFFVKGEPRNLEPVLTVADMRRIREKNMGHNERKGPNEKNV